MKKMIEISGLEKKYNNKPVLNNVNLSVNENDVFGLIGPNGAGKTTMIKCILGLLNFSKGDILIDGESILKNKSAKLKIGAMIDYPCFYPYLSAYKNLQLYTNILGLDTKRIDEVLEIVKLSKDKRKKVGSFSMGMKQRLAVARAFLAKPDIVILDEPTNGLDPKGVMEMRKMIVDFKNYEKITFIYCSHILNEVQNLCNNVAIINKGEVIVQDSINNLINSNVESYRILVEKSYVGNLKISLRNIVSSIKEVEGGVLVQLQKDTFSEMNKALVKDSIAINSIEKVNNSLENIFLERIADK